jgi:hypothetical protein
MKFGGFFYTYFQELFICGKKWFTAFKLFIIQKKLCCEWKTLFILVTDVQRRLTTALAIDERQKKVKNPPNELLLYSVHRHQNFPDGMTL